MLKHHCRDRIGKVNLVIILIKFETNLKMYIKITRFVLQAYTR